RRHHPFGIGVQRTCVKARAGLVLAALLGSWYRTLGLFAGHDLSGTHRPTPFRDTRVPDRRQSSPRGARMKVRWSRGVRRLTLLAFAATLLAPAMAGAQGKVSGKATFSGTPPPASKLKMDADPVCAAAHPDGATSEDIVVGDGGGL